MSCGGTRDALGPVCWGVQWIRPAPARLTDAWSIWDLGNMEARSASRAFLLCSSEQCLRCVRAHCPAGTSGSVDVMSRSCLTWSVVDSSSAWRLPGQWPHLETPLDMFNKTTGQFAAMFVATKEGISSQNMIISLHSTAFSQHETENWSHRNPTLQHYSY